MNLTPQREFWNGNAVEPLVKASGNCAGRTCGVYRDIMFRALRTRSSLHGI